MSADDLDRNLDRNLEVKAIAQIRDALVTLSYAADGFYEDEAQVSMDALDWIEDRLSAARLHRLEAQP